MAIYSLGGKDYSSKDAIKKQFQQILAAYEVGETLSPVHHAFVYDLLQWHPNASQKIGCGVAAFKIHIPKPWNHKGVLLVREDGTTTDFSYKVCLNPKLADQTVKFNAAMRRAIADEVAAYKFHRFNELSVDGYVLCEATSDRISWDETHVDHYPVAFADLVDEYVKQSGLDINSVQFLSGDNQTQSIFADLALSEDFAQWHRAMARLRLVKAEFNIRAGRHKGEVEA